MIYPGCFLAMRPVLLGGSEHKPTKMKDSFNLAKWIVQTNSVSLKWSKIVNSATLIASLLCCVLNGVTAGFDQVPLTMCKKACSAS